MVIFAFWIAVMLLTLVALALLLPPLLRSRDQAQANRRAIERELATLKRRFETGEVDAATHANERERLSAALVAAVESRGPAPARGLAAMLALVLPAAALTLYFAIGRPEALDYPEATAPTPPQNMTEAVASLEARLREQPDDVDGWLLLARSYRAIERFDDALRATSSAYALAPRSPDVMAEHAELMTLNTPTRRFDGEARRLLDEALAINANHQKTLWLLGIAEFQAERYSDAVTYWQRLRALIPDGSSVAAGVDEQIAAAQARAGSGESSPAAVATANESSDTRQDMAVNEPRLLVTVDIDPSLRERIAASDTLFIFVRAPAGGPPLAIRRIDGPALPARVTLTQNDRMLEGMQIEVGAEVSVGARLSKTGQALAQPGDLQTTVHTLTLAATNTVELVIDSVVE